MDNGEHHDVAIRRECNFDALEERYLIETLGDARHVCTRASGKVEINGDLYKALQNDDVCVATGRKREHFWLKSH
jgi:hypothetical protein